MSDRWGRAVALVVGATLLGLPVMAAQPELWEGLVGGAIAATGGVVVLWRWDSLSMRDVLVGAVLFRLAFFPLEPVLTDDPFRYLWDGWMQLEGINPYRFRPSDVALATYQDTALYDALNSEDFYSVYPPISQAFFLAGTALGQWVGGAGPPGTAAALATKGLFVLAEGAGVLLLARMADARTVLLYAWNPLVLLETAGQGHTEAALVPLLLTALWATRTGRGRVASLAIAGAGLVKLYPLVLGPLLLRRFGWRAVWPGALLTAAATAPYAAPYVLPHLQESVNLYVRYFEFNAGPYYAVKELFGAATGADWSKQIGPAFRVLYLTSLPVMYAVDAWRDLSFRRAALWTLGLFFVFSTTVHPWYLLAILPLAVVGERPAWGWIWLGASSLGTYLFYQGGAYGPWVAVGWMGALFLAVWQLPLRRWIREGRTTAGRTLDAFLQSAQKRRAHEKATRIAPYVEAIEIEGDGAAPLRVLDLGAGEGYVGQALAEQLNGSHGAEGRLSETADVQPRPASAEASVQTTRAQANAVVHLIDVVDMNRTDLPHQVYDGRSLPLPDDAVDATVLYFVLHHCADPDQVLAEALRVSRRVILVESVVTHPLQHRLLRRLDVQANRLRSAGRMTSQEEHLSFRTADAWVKTAKSLGARIIHRVDHGNTVHPQVTLVVEG